MFFQFQWTEVRLSQQTIGFGLTATTKLWPDEALLAAHASMAAIAHLLANVPVTGDFASVRISPDEGWRLVNIVSESEFEYQRSYQVTAWRKS